MSQPPRDFDFQAIADFWGQIGKSVLQAQQGLAQICAAFCTTPLMMAKGSTTAFGADGTQLAQSVCLVSQFWAEAARLSGTLVAMMTPSAGKRLDPTIAASLRAIADPRSWFAHAGGLDTVIARLADGAHFADLGTAEREQVRFVQAWTLMQRRALEHSAVVLEAWLRAGRAFCHALADERRAPQPPTGRAILDLWTSTANEILLETQRSERFLESQAAMLRAGAELRLVQRRLAEQVAEQFDMPSRTELDDVHRTMTELRRDVRRLRHEMTTLGGQPAAAAAQ